MEKEFKKLQKIQDSLEGQMALLSNMINFYTDFIGYVVWVSGDGFCVVNEDTNGDIALLGSCIRFIKENNELTVEQHKNLCI